MTIIQNSIDISRPVEDVYRFLSDMNNHEQLMPENIHNWSSTEDQAQFTIRHMASLSLRISERLENKELVSIPVEETPFPLTLRWKLETTPDGLTRASFVIEAGLNMMMKMMASGPLQKLVDFQVARLKEVFA